MFCNFFCIVRPFPRCRPKVDEGENFHLALDFRSTVKGFNLTLYFQLDENALAFILPKLWDRRAIWKFDFILLRASRDLNLEANRYPSRLVRGLTRKEGDSGSTTKRQQLLSSGGDDFPSSGNGSAMAAATFSTQLDLELLVRCWIEDDFTSNKIGSVSPSSFFPYFLLPLFLGLVECVFLRDGGCKFLKKLVEEDLSKRIRGLWGSEVVSVRNECVPQWRFARSFLKSEWAQSLLFLTRTSEGRAVRFWFFFFPFF